MQHILSLHNPSVKQIRKLINDTTERQRKRQFVTEGIHLAQAFLNSGNIPLDVAVSESGMKNKEIAKILDSLSTHKASRILLSDGVMQSISGVQAASNILLVCGYMDQPINRSVIEHESIILLENIQDPGNMGTILRTTAASGIRHAVLSKECASPWSPKTLRAGMGAQFAINIFEDQDLLDWLSAKNNTTIATFIGPGTESLYDLDLNKPVTWIFGNEGSGVSMSLAEKCMHRVMIPHTDKVESLNVSVAAAVCLFEQYRQTTR